MSGIQALAAAAAATPRISAPTASTVLTTVVSGSGIVTSASLPQMALQTTSGQAQLLQSAPQLTAFSVAGSTASTTLSTPTGSPIRIVQTQGSPTYRVSTASGALGK